MPTPSQSLMGTSASQSSLPFPASSSLAASNAAQSLTKPGFPSGSGKTIPFEHPGSCGRQGVDSGVRVGAGAGAGAGVAFCVAVGLGPSVGVAVGLDVGVVKGVGLAVAVGVSTGVVAEDLVESPAVALASTVTTVALAAS